MLAALLLNLSASATYPDLPQHVDTRVARGSGTKVQIAPNGIVGAQARYTSTVYQILSVHDFLTLDERDTIIAFYEANARQTIDWTAQEDGATYHNCVFAGQNAVAWTPKRRLAATVFRVEVRLLTSAA